MARREQRSAGVRDRVVEQAILDAAERELQDAALHDVSVETIIKRAGVSRATFYFYFTSKYAVLAALFRRVLDDVHEVFTTTWASRAEDAPEQGLDAALGASFALFRRHAPMLRSVADAWQVQAEVGESFRAMISRLIEAAGAQIDRERAAGIAPPGLDSRALAAAMIWMNERCFYVASLSAEPAFGSDEEMVTALVAVWTAAVYGRPAAMPSPGASSSG